MTGESPDRSPLDPSEAELEALTRGVLDLAREWRELERQGPVLPSVDGASLRELWDGDPPRSGCTVEELLERLRSDLLPHARRNGHPGFLGYVQASAAPAGALADYLASVLNQNVTAWRSAPGATEMELLVVRWLARLIGFEGQQGLLVGGGSAANLTSIGCAWRRAMVDATKESDPRPVAYLTREAHLSLVKALRFVGLDREGVRWIEMDGERRMDPDDLRRALGKDLDAGRTPVCLCASAGSASTGAVDPLEELGDIAREAGVWFHVDGAYGAPVAMLSRTPEGQRIRAGLARADSVSIDPHKWLFAPLDVGCVLLRNADDSERTYREDADYTQVFEQKPIEAFAFFDHGLELSRRFRALKVWMILSLYGTDALGEAIGDNLELARMLAERVREHPRLELMASSLSVVCFRYRPGGELGSEELERLNARVLESLIDGGDFFLSPTRVDGAYALRVCLVNFRTRRRHLEALLDEVLRAGDQGFTGSPTST